MKINDERNTVTLKCCLNPKKIENAKIIQISEYLDSIRKYTYLNSECFIKNKINLKMFKFMCIVSNVIKLFAPIIY